MHVERPKEALLQEVIEAGQAGDLPRARDLLLRLLGRDNQEPLYWLLMSTAVESRGERIYCLHNVLFLDPQNGAALHDLDLLGAEIPQPEGPAAKPTGQTDWQTAQIAIPTRTRKRKQEDQVSPAGILGVLGVGAAVILFGYYVAENNLLTPFFASEGAPSVMIGTSTPRIVASEAALLAPEQLLSLTYTPTPRYVNTPHPGETVFEEGLNAMDQQKWETAAQAFRLYLASNPDSPDAAYFLGEALLALEDLAGAEEAFAQSLDINAQFAPAYLGRARLSIKEEAESAAILTDLNTAILLDAAFVDAYLERANFAIEQNDYAEALEDLTVAERLSPDSALVQYYKARTYLARKDYANAMQAGQRAYEIDITLLPNYLVLAQAQQELKRYSESIAIMQTYLTFEPPNAFGWEVLGLGYELSGQHDLALEAFEHALSIDPRLAKAAYYQGLEAQGQRNSQLAISFFQTAVSGDPDWFEPRLALAQVYLDIGRPSTAFFELNASSSLVENDEQRAAFFYWRATILEALGQNENALADWRSLLSLPSASVPPEWRLTAQTRVQAAQ
ncbi:MAG: tetratricopeptide repeat protein [Anaerolineales bacterium]